MGWSGWRYLARPAVEEKNFLQVNMLLKAFFIFVKYRYLEAKLHVVVR